jgi:hypothetical protein
LEGSYKVEVPSKKQARDNFPWYLFGDTMVAAEEAEEDRSAEEVLEEFADPSGFSGGLYPENEKLQSHTSPI